MSAVLRVCIHTRILGGSGRLVCRFLFFLRSIIVGPYHRSKPEYYPCLGRKEDRTRILEESYLLSHAYHRREPSVDYEQF